MVRRSALAFAFVAVVAANASASEIGH